MQIRDAVDDVRHERAPRRRASRPRSASSEASRLRARRATREIDANRSASASRRASSPNVMPARATLIDVGRPDAATGRADRLRAASPLARPRSARRDTGSTTCARSEIFTRETSTPIAASRVELRRAGRWQADDRSAADEQLGVRIERARRNDAQRELGVADDDRVAGVVAAAETRDDVVVLRVSRRCGPCLRRPTGSRDDIGLTATRRSLSRTGAHNLRARRLFGGTRRSLGVAHRDLARRLGTASSRTPRIARWASRNLGG